MIAGFTCDNCGTVIEEGAFIAVIGKAPASGLSIPIARADKLFDEVGNTYCRECVTSFEISEREKPAE